jgi:hypothetical protein
VRLELAELHHRGAAADGGEIAQNQSGSYPWYNLSPLFILRTRFSGHDLCVQ